MARMKKVIVDGKAFWQLGNRKRYFTTKELAKAEIRYDKAKKKSKKSKKKKK